MAGKKYVVLADLSLLLIAVAWGYTFVLTKDLLEEVTPLFFVGTRFLLSALCIALWKWREIKTISLSLWKDGFICGLFLWAAFVLQIYGIDLTTPGKAGVITGTSVILVPFLYFLIARAPIKPGPILGSLLLFSGLCMLSWNGDFVGINLGDLLVLGCAVCFALHVVMVDRTLQQKENVGTLPFVMIQLAVVGVVSLLLAFFTEPLPKLLSPYGWFAYSFDLFVGTLLAYLVQVKAQQYTPPTHVSLFLALESVFAFLFSWMLWGEEVTTQVIWGITLILCGIFITELLEALSKPKKLSSSPETEKEESSWHEPAG